MCVRACVHVCMCVFVLLKVYMGAFIGLASGAPAEHINCTVFRDGTETNAEE